MSRAEELQNEPTDDELEAWDWRARLRELDRNVNWLSRRTGWHYRAVYRYFNREATVPVGFLRAAFSVIGRSGS